MPTSMQDIYIEMPSLMQIATLPSPKLKLSIHGIVAIKYPKEV